MTNTSPTLVHPYSVFFSNEAFEGFCRVARTIIISKVSTLQVVTGISECSSTNPHQLVFLVKMYGSYITYCIIAKGLQIHKRIAVISAESVRSTQPDITSFILNHIIDTIRRKSVTSSHASSCKHIFSCCPRCNQQAQNQHQDFGFLSIECHIVVSLAAKILLFGQLSKCSDEKPTIIIGIIVLLRAKF